MSYLIIGLIVVILLAICPLVTIWALNNLFLLGIPYTLATWAATAWLGIVVGGAGYQGKS